MSESDRGNKLVLTCGDQRLDWRFHKALEDKFGRVYRCAIAGPDEAIHGEEKHLDNVVFNTGRFQELAGITERIDIVHEDCAGCQCDPKTHEANALKLTKVINLRTRFTGETQTYIARKPQIEDAVWSFHRLDHASVVDEVEDSKTVLAA